MMISPHIFFSFFFTFFVFSFLNNAAFSVIKMLTKQFFSTSIKNKLYTLLQKRPRYTATSTMVYLKFVYQTQYLYKYKDSTNSSKSICKICDLEAVCG